jgi:hypothetical protein
MPASVYNKRSEHEWTTSAEALRGRIDRRLRKLVPYREFVYDHSTCGFYVRIPNHSDPGNPQLIGQYYYMHFSGLARMLGLFDEMNGCYKLPSITCIDRQGKEYPETVLPLALRFPVITPILSDAIRALEAKGYTVTPPIEPSEPFTDAQIERAFTAPVTEPEVHGGGCIWFEDNTQCNCGIWDDGDYDER